MATAQSTMAYRPPCEFRDISAGAPRIDSAARPAARPSIPASQGVAYTPFAVVLGDVVIHQMLLDQWSPGTL